MPPENGSQIATARAAKGAPASREDQERVAANARGRQRERERADGAVTRDVSSGQARAPIAAKAFAALADNVRDYAIFLMDPSGIITFWGEGARLIKGWSRDQAEGAHLRLLYPARGSEDGTAEEHLAEAVEKGEYSGEGNRIRSDGSTFWAGITLTALRDENGELLGFAKTTRDMTARRAADALLQSAAEDAETARQDAVVANAAKSSFLATMSHEIRTPINAVLGYLQLLDLEIAGPLSAAQRQHLARATASARHLLELITEVLDFSRIEADRVTVGRATFRIGDVVQEAIGLVTPQAQAKGLAINEDVSGAASHLNAWGDDGRVRQILVNLLGNAVKFTDHREGELARVSVSAGTATQPARDAQLSGDGPWVFVRVEDTGPGIAPERIGAIFEPFVQANMTLTRTHGGTGLGLAISRRLARLMGGDITVTSQPGIGSSFLVWLPAEPVQSSLELHGQDGTIAGRRADVAISVAPPAVTTAGIDDSTVRIDPAADGGRATPRPTTSEAGRLHAVADVLLEQLQPTLQTIIGRLRTDAATPAARVEDKPGVEDHLASFIVDTAAMFQHLEAIALSAAGEPSAEVRDVAAIQRVVAERHGAQRARLGWKESAIRREFEIILDEVRASVRRHAPQRLAAPNDDTRMREAERAIELLTQFLAATERLSIEAYRRAGGA